VREQPDWRVAPAPYALVRELAAEAGVSEAMAQVLVRRGFADAPTVSAFLHPDYRVHDPYLMPGMREARRRIDRALQLGEPIAVHGDYDADGITATFLLVSVLRQLEADVRWHLPNRFSEGYGVSAAAVEELAAAGVKLLVTVDCGISARVEVASAVELGMDVIVTDHHEISGDVPGCVVVTPKLPGYPCADLAGVGVAFKLAHALLEEPAEELVEVPLALRPLADVVAIGTIADIVPLTGENRALVAIGLGRLRSSPRPGLAALMEVAGVKPGSVNAGTVGFRLGPRLNAAGRLEDASLALELLECPDRDTAMPLALRLNELNHERQAIEAAIFQQACEQVPDPVPPALVLSAPGWHEGVVGIVASRVVERFNRPTIMLSEDGEEAKGSGRSIPAFDLLAAVDACADHLLAYGGHRAACGMRLRTAEVAAFRDAFVAQARAALGDADLRRTLSVDAVVSGDELTLELADELELLAPHGLGNRKVTLLLRGAEIVSPRRTRDGKHLQYRVRCNGASCQAIHFNFGDVPLPDGGGRFDVPLALSKNEYNGSVSAQVEVKALCGVGSPETDLCRTGCTSACRDRLSGPDLWDELLRGPQVEPGGEDAAGALEEARRAGRLVDRRGRPAAASLAALAAGAERLLVLVADVAASRPLLSRDVLSPHLAAGGLYVQPACAGRVPAAAAADVVMTSYDLLAARPSVAEGFTHVAFVDPPCTRRLLAVVAAAAPDAWLHALWGPAEAQAAGRFAVEELDLDTVMRRSWRTLSDGRGRFDDALAQELLRGERSLRPAGAIAAALRALGDAGLLQLDESGSYHLERPQSKVDVTGTDTFRRWHTLFRTQEFLRTCLTAAL
jgi:single-stranded-DNA-specific exonuclease